MGEQGRLLLKEFARAEGASVTFESYWEDPDLPAGGGGRHSVMKPAGELLSH